MKQDRKPSDGAEATPAAAAAAAAAAQVAAAEAEAEAEATPAAAADAAARRTAAEAEATAAAEAAAAADPPPESTSAFWPKPIPWPERFQKGVEDFTQERVARETAESEGQAAQERVDSARKALTAAEAERDTAAARAGEIRTRRVQKARDLRALLTEFIGDYGN